MLLSFHQFQPFLEDFIHENYEYVLLDANNEFEEYTQQDKKTENLMPIKESSETDPLKKNLIDTISQYEWILSQNKFSDSTEKETAEKLVESLRKQLKEYEQRKTQSMSKNDTNLGKTKEELRMKGLTEIFHFYARQHIPHGIAFEQLVIIMNQVLLKYKINRSIWENSQVSAKISKFLYQGWILKEHLTLVQSIINHLNLNNFIKLL